ncbi:MAG TPA: DbpA RNA binding domain-containing protein [Gemmatimonadales bacterium]|nr:DbpA RNA binding domain-containing protein [Gemmatimonadales bacterium]
MPSFQDLHLTPNLAAALERLGWNADDAGVRETIPTAARGHNLVAATPPAPVYATPALAGVLARTGRGARALLLAPTGQLDEWGRVAHGLAGNGGARVQVAHGTARAMRRLKADAVDLLIATPETALTLLSRSALSMDAVTSLFLAWPESWESEDSISPLMQDLSKEAQRIIYTASPDRVAALVERYARKAPTARAAGLERGPTGPVRTVSVSWARRVTALAELVELLDPATMAIWTLDRSYHHAIAQAVGLNDPELRLVSGDAPQAETVVAFDLPTGERLQQLAAAGEVVMLVPPAAESYAARIANPRRPLQLAGMADRVATRAAAQRALITRAIENGAAERAILTLAPLFERHDPTAVAAALFALWSSSAPIEEPSRVPDIPATAKIYVGVGKKDGATANDLVAVLTKELRVERGKIGRIELRDAYSLVEIPAQDAEKVALALNGVTIRRRRVTARVDRGPSRPPRREGSGPGRPARRPS